MKHKVISWKNLPTRLPVWPSIIIWLLMDRVHPPEWLVGVGYTIMVLIWIMAIVSMVTETKVDIFDK